MKKKLQIFISSTYTDLQEERQAAVEAILNAGHIPAGMELFKASNQSQLETVKRWIDECDIYLLILGGRYGSIEPKSQKSYTHLEYEYALDKGMPFFAVVMKKEALNNKVKKYGLEVSEQDNPAKLKEFKGLVTSKMCEFFDDNKDIKLTILSSIQELQKLHNFTGWISGNEIAELEQLRTENAALKKQIVELRSRIDLPAPPRNSEEKSLDRKYYAFLIAIFEATGGSRNAIVMLDEVGQQLGFDEKEAVLISTYLQDEGFIKFVTLEGRISITHQGVLFLEKTSKKISQLTELEKTVLKTLHEKDYRAGGIPKYVTFAPLLEEQENKQSELAYYLIRMERNRFIEFQHEPFIKGGRSHPKYNNNVIDIMFDRIFISEKGTDLLNYI